MNVAERIIAKFGGPKIVAEALGLSVTQIYRWTYPSERGGTNGLIPAQHQSVLLALARDRGVDLSPDDFFEQAA